MGADCTSPVSGEVPRLTDSDGDGVYTGSLVLPSGHNNVITYKFGAYYPGIETVPGDNGSMDNEAGFGADRVIYIPSETSGNIALEVTFGENNANNPWLSNDHETIVLNQFMIHGNYPNPFNPNTVIEFSLDIKSEVNIQVFNIKGELVRDINMGDTPSGIHSAIWNAKDNFGRVVPSGMYIYSITSNQRTISDKMLFMK
tara:strand:- start:104 stop:703 length:600 start_codon:yes stop_codon:yes gene_type:complete